MCQLEFESGDINPIAYATCMTCKTRWRRRITHGKLTYEKWAYRIPETNIPFPFVGGGIKLGPRWYRWVKVKEKEVSASEFPQIKHKQEVEKRGKIYDERILLKAHDYAHYEFELFKGNKVEGEISSDAPLDIWFLDVENLERFVKGKSFDEEDGTEDVYEAKLCFEAPRKGFWYVVIDNRNKTSTTAKVHLDSKH